MAFASSILRRILETAIVAGALAFALPASANEWVDMGPLGSAANGHIWSRVINEAGHTQGRNEEWKIPYTTRARLDFQLLAPNANQIDARLRYTGRYGDQIELLLSAAENTAPGGYRKAYGPWDPDDARNMRIVLFNRLPNMDQRYQLIVSGLPQDAQPKPPQPQPQPQPQPKEQRKSDLFGSWSRSLANNTAEQITIQPRGDQVEIIFFNDKGAERARMLGAIENGEFVGVAAQRRVRISLSGRQLTYSSVGLDGANPRQGIFTRMGSGGE